MSMKKWIVAAFVLLTLVGCNIETGSNNSDFEVTIKTTDKFSQESTTFTQGEEITFTLTIRNISSEIQTLHFTSGQQYDFVVKNTEGTEIWRWSNGMAFTQALTSYRLVPGQSQIFTYTWDQVISSDGTIIPVGNYVLEAQKIGIDITPRQALAII